MTEAYDTKDGARLRIYTPDWFEDRFGLLLFRSAKDAGVSVGPSGEQRIRFGILSPAGQKSIHLVFGKQEIGLVFTK